MYCKKCGRENNDNASFCVECGAPLGQELDENTFATYQADVGQEAQNYQSSAQNSATYNSATAQDFAQYQDIQTQAMPYRSTAQPTSLQQDDRQVSVGNWMWTMVIMCIPVASLVMCFVWAFNSSVVPSKRNYFKAMLIWQLIFVGLIITVVITIWIISAVNAASYSYTPRSYYSYY